MQTIELAPQQNISNKQFAKVNAIVKYMNNDWHTETICAIDPECRILEAVPQEWIDGDKPIVFENSDYSNKIYKFEALPKPYTDKTFIFSNLDLWWITWWRDALKSMKQGDLFPSSESMFAFALHFNSVDKIIQTNHVVFQWQK